MITRLVLIAAMFLLTLQTQGLVLDGQFEDWDGMPFVSDPAGDGPNPHTDLISFSWGTNPDESSIYWMAQRETVQSGNSAIFYTVWLDLNDNEQYQDMVDRKIVIEYDPSKNSSDVIVTVSSGTGELINQYSGDWGDLANDGQQRVEWNVSFDDLGLDIHQTIHMFVSASQNANENTVDRVPDIGDITWSPIPLLGWPVLLGLFVVAILWVSLQIKRKWIR